MKYISIHIISIFVLLSCGGTTIPSDPIRDMKRDFKDKNVYTVLLNDMDLKDDQYLHQYKVIEVTKDQKILYQTTDWTRVSDDFFFLHEDDLGWRFCLKPKKEKLITWLPLRGLPTLLAKRNMAHGGWMLTEMFIRGALERKPENWKKNWGLPGWKLLAVNTSITKKSICLTNLIMVIR